MYIVSKTCLCFDIYIRLFTAAVVCGCVHCSDEESPALSGVQFIDLCHLLQHIHSSVPRRDPTPSQLTLTRQQSQGDACRINIKRLSQGDACRINIKRLILTKQIPAYVLGGGGESVGGFKLTSLGIHHHNHKT